MLFGAELSMETMLFSAELSASMKTDVIQRRIIYVLFLFQKSRSYHKKLVTANPECNFRIPSVVRTQFPDKAG
jgi:hypothetical protein